MKSPLTLAWREAVRDFLPADLGMTAFYKLLGWTKTGRLSAATQNPDLRLSRYVEIADALGADRRKFVLRVMDYYESLGMVPRAPRKKGLRRKCVRP